VLSGLKVDHIFLLTVNFLFTVAAGRAAAKTSRADIMLARPLQLHYAGLTLCRVKLNQDIVMLAWILNLVETNKVAFGTSPAAQSTFFLLHLAFASSLFDGKSELGIDELESKFAALVSLLERVCDSQLEVHGIGVRELFEEC
jgi:hypothetical protein